MTVSVLLIEDDERNLRSKKALLSTFPGCDRIVGVRDPDAAIHSIRLNPHFNLVIADIDLSKSSKKKDDHNKGGVAVARWIRDSSYPAFVAGYSSFFAGDELMKSDRQFFDDIVDRSVSGSDLDDKFSGWIARASEMDRSNRLRDFIYEAYKNSNKKEILDKIPVVSLDTLIDYDDDELENIRSSGFSLSILLPDVDDEIRRAIPIWSRREGGNTYIEVLGQPYLYAEGSSDEEAKEALKVLILGYYEDLKCKDPNKEMGSYVKIMFLFLESLFK
ncbi:hypothetical protein GVN24_16085 [Rhizobium sp. CRIBSB]|nr:hypothetical protein [Rhizobium sp. CRIBSB]